MLKDERKRGEMGERGKKKKYQGEGAMRKESGAAGNGGSPRAGRGGVGRRGGGGRGAGIFYDVRSDPSTRRAFLQIHINDLTLER